ncbi:Translocon-associated protein, gamma subunit, partial [Opisthorchis viverrini]
MAVKITKEDELLLEMYSRAASKKSDHLIYGNAILISLIPIWLFWRIHGLALVANSILYVIVSTACAFLMSYAYTGAKAPLMERFVLMLDIVYVAAKRSESISKELAAETGKDKKLTRKERDDAVRERTREVADYESTTYSIFFNNCVYLLILLASSMVLQHFSAHVYPFYRHLLFN